MCAVCAGDSFSTSLEERKAVFDARFHDRFGDLDSKDAPPGMVPLERPESESMVFNLLLNSQSATMGLLASGRHVWDSSAGMTLLTARPDRHQRGRQAHAEQYAGRAGLFGGAPHHWHTR